MIRCAWVEEDPQGVFLCRVCGFTSPRNAVGVVPWNRPCDVQDGEPPCDPPQSSRGSVPQGLGDLVESALRFIGVTSEGVSRWMGRPCNCKERREKLNRLSRWAMRIMTGRDEKGKEYLEKIIEDD